MAEDTMDTPETQAIPDPGTTKWVPIWNPISTGPVGPQGPVGATGVQGPMGPAGPQGIQGIQGIPGTPGEMWFAGAGAPAGALAGSVTGDWYLDTANGDVYEKTATTIWTLRGNIKGTPGEKWFSGSGAPSGSLAGSLIGDWYLDTLTGDVYEKTAAAAWTARANIKGPQGLQGPQGIQGVKGDPGNPAANHHTYHEPSGFDQITRLDLTGATYPQLQLTAALPLMMWKDTNAPVDKKQWRIWVNDGVFTFDMMNDLSNTVLAVPLTMWSDGSVATGGNLTVATSYYPSFILKNSSVAVDSRYWWIRAPQDGTLVVQAINDANTLIQAQPLTLLRNGDVTVPRMIVTNSVAVGATLVLREVATDIAIMNSQAYLRINTTAYGQVTYMDMAGSWVMSGNVDAGGRLLANGMVIAGNTQTIGGAPSLSTSTTTVLQVKTASTVHMDFGGVMDSDYAFWMQTKVNGQNSSYPLRINPLGGSVSIGASLYVTGNVQLTSNLHSTGYIYPGRIDVSGQQAVWALMSHGGYGLYINTGLYVVGAVWATQLVTHALQFKTVHTAPTGRRTKEFDTQNFPGTDLAANAGWIQAHDDTGAVIYFPYWKKETANDNVREHAPDDAGEGSGFPEPPELSDAADGADGERGSS